MRIKEPVILYIIGVLMFVGIFQLHTSVVNNRDSKPIDKPKVVSPIIVKKQEKPISKIEGLNNRLSKLKEDLKYRPNKNVLADDILDLEDDLKDILEDRNSKVEDRHYSRDMLNSLYQEVNKGELIYMKKMNMLPVIIGVALVLGVSTIGLFIGASRF